MCLLWKIGKEPLAFCAKLLAFMKFPTPEKIFVVLFSLLVLALSFYPIYHRNKITPADRFYVGTTYYTADYAGYVAAIEQGRNGSWTYTDKFTSEDFPKTILYYPYLILGHIASIINLSSILMYHLARFFFGLLYLFLFYKIIKIVYPQNNRLGFAKRIIAFLLVLFSSSFVLWENSTPVVSRIARMIAEIQVVNRFVIQPHFLLGNVFLLLCIFLYLKYENFQKLKYILLCGLVVFFAAFFRPSNVIVFLFGMLFLLRWNFNRKRLVFYSVVFLSFLPGIFYLWYLKNKYDFLPYFKYDYFNHAQFNLWDVFLVLGPVVFLFFFSLKSIKEKKILILCGFLAANFFCLFILPFFYPINPVRFLQTPMFGLLAILGAEGIFRISQKIVIIVLVTLTTLTLSVPAIWLDFWHEVNLYYDAYYIWPPKGYKNGLSFLKENSKPRDLVLTYMSLSSLVPMISGNSVHWGHANETLDYEKKQKLVEAFYAGKMTKTEGENFVKNNKIKFVLVGREEKTLGSFQYDFLNRVWEDQDLSVYKSRFKF